MKNIIIFLVLLSSLSVMGADNPSDTLKKPKVKKEKPEILTPYHKNVIKFNPTPMLLLAETKNITFSYERMIKKNQSISLQVGYLLFPRITDDTLVHLLALTDRNKKGINLALDYRFYPTSRNRRPAPDGLYLGPYLSYYGFRFKNKFDIIQMASDKEGAFDGKLNIVNLGLEIGYQFIFWKRFSIDLLMFGPSLSYYSGSLEVSGQLDKDQIRQIDQETAEKILNKFPFLKSMFNSETLTFTGNRTRFATGFRYCFQFGFHF